MAAYQHNNPWAEKLLQVSLPDGDEAWRAMESRLDAQGPRWWNRDARRWVLLILLLLLLIGVCNCPGRGRLHTPGSARIVPGPTPAAKRTIPTITAAHQRLAGTPVTPPTPPPTRRMEPDEPPAHPETVSAAKLHNPARHHPGTAAPSSIPTPRGTTTPPGTAAPLNMPAPPATTPRRGSPPPPITITATANTGTPPNTGTPRSTGTPPVTTAPPNTGTPPGTTTATPTTATPPGTPLPPATPATTPIHAPPATNDTAGKQPRPIPPTIKGSPAKLTPPKDSSRKKPTPPPKQEDQKEKENGLMAAIGLNQFFPLGGQQSAYNSNGTSGTLSDYIPVPVLRYYFNRNLYVQLEAQLNTPQATKKNFVISSPPPDTSSVSGQQIVSTATLQQLFYFNIPLSVHYTLFDNFDIGTGLQFSHLTNAIGAFDTTASPLLSVNNPALTPLSTTNEVKSFKGEALYQKIKTNEFRFLLDMSYTYKHFIGGLRYNQALTKFVDIQLATGQVAQGRNSSLQLYLRYILWDGRKKRISPAK